MAATVVAVMMIAEAIIRTGDDQWIGACGTARTDRKVDRKARTLLRAFPTERQFARFCAAQQITDTWKIDVE